jgi:hypothetical protein
LHLNVNFAAGSLSSYDPFSINYLKSRLPIDRHSIIGGRVYMHTWGKYKRLAADIDSLPWPCSLTEFSFYKDNFILPFLFKSKGVTTEGLDELCKWVLNHSKIVGITETEIRDLYKDFIDWVEQLMEGEDV